MGSPLTYLALVLACVGVGAQLMDRKGPWRKTIRAGAFSGAAFFVFLFVVSTIWGPTAASQSVRPSISQSSTGDCSPNIIGSNNTNNCNSTPVITASSQTKTRSNNSKAPWRTTFFISATAPVQTGNLELTCSGPCIKAGIGRISQFGFSSGSNGPIPGHPNTGPV